MNIDLVRERVIKVLYVFTCCLHPDGGFYRIDHFADLYVMEFASNEEEARLNVFEDGDTYYDADDDVIELIRADLIKYSNSNM